MDGWQPSTFTPDSDQNTSLPTTPGVPLSQTPLPSSNLLVTDPSVNQIPNTQNTNNPKDNHSSSPKSWQPTTFTPDMPVTQNTQPDKQIGVSHNQSPSATQDDTTPEMFRQVGIAGNAIAGAVPRNLTGTLDMVNHGANSVYNMVNKYAGTNIPMAADFEPVVDKAINSSGLVAPPQTAADRANIDAAALLLGGGESGINSAKAIAQNAMGYLSKTPKITADMLKQAASSVYQGARDAGVVFNDDAAKGASTAMQDAMTASGKLNPRLHPLATGLQEDFNSQLENGNVGLDDLEQHRQLLNQGITKDTDTFGKMGPDGQKMVAAKKGLDNWMATMDPETSLKSGDPDAIDMLTNYARPTWTQAAKLQDVEHVIDRASMMDNPTTALKTGFRNMALGAKSNGYSDEEYAALDKAARTGVGVDALRVMGSRLGPIITGATGTGIGGPLGGAIGYGAMAAGTTAARKGAEFLQMQKAKNLANVIARGAPLQPVGASVVSPVGTATGIGDVLPLAGGIEAAAEQPKQQQARGGAIKPHSGRIFAKPKSYPALQNRK